MKSHEWGYKISVLADVPRFPYNFEIATNINRYQEVPEKPNLGVAGSVMIRMGRIDPKSISHQIFYDN